MQVFLSKKFCLEKIKKLVFFEKLNKIALQKLDLQ